MTDAISLAEDALARTDGDALVRVVAERSLSLRFARSSPTQSTAVDDLDVEVVVLRDGHAGLATTNRLDDAGLRDAARRATEAATVAARHAGGPGPYPAPAPRTVAEGLAGWDARTAALEPADGGDAIEGAIVQSARSGLEAFGIWSAGEVTHAIASSSGARLVDRVTDGYMKVICRDDAGRCGFASATSMTSAACDGAELAGLASAKVSPADPVELAPGTYPVVFDADAVAELLSFAGILLFNGLAHVEGRGALHGRIGDLVAAPGVTITDDPRAAGTLLRAFDADGVRKQPVSLIAAGVARGVVHDLRSAAVAGTGTSSTGHATAPGGAPDGPEATNLVLSPGNADGVRDLCRPITRGLYVTRLWYTNTVRERDAIVTSMTRDGTFLIEDGRITRPVRDVRITDGLLDVLAAVEAVGRDPRLIGHGEFYGRRFAHGVLCPPVRVGAVRVTGGA